MTQKKRETQPDLTLTLTLTLTKLRAHSLHPDYLPHSTLTPIPHYLTHSTTNLNRGGAQGDSAQGLHTAGGPDLTTWF